MPNYGLEDVVVVPRRFFEHILMSENLSTIRVLAFFLTSTEAGRPEIGASYSDISQATGLCRQSVQEGLNRAIEQGYLHQVQAGTFFSPASYTLVGYQVSGIGEQVSEEEAEMLAEDDALLTEPYPDYPYQQEWSTNQQWYENHTTPPSSIESINRIEDRIELESKEAVYFSDHPQKVDHPATYPPEVVHISAYLTNLGNDFSVELGDPTHTRSNRTQIHNLWHKSGLAEKDFAMVMYEARKLTKQFAIIRPGEKEPPPGQTRNRMAYFFTVLRDLLGLPVEKKNQGTQKTSENHRDTQRRLRN